MDSLALDVLPDNICFSFVFVDDLLGFHHSIGLALIHPSPGFSVGVVVELRIHYVCRNRKCIALDDIIIVCLFCHMALNCASEMLAVSQIHTHTYTGLTQWVFVKSSDGLNTPHAIQLRLRCF